MSQPDLSRDAWVATIAADHFIYRYPFLTYTNAGDRQRRLLVDGAELFPDIVVIDPRMPGARLFESAAAVVEVATVSTVRLREAERWQRIARLDAAFYLYVPRGYGWLAGVLCEGIAPVDIREYWSAEDGAPCYWSQRDRRQLPSKRPEVVLGALRQPHGTGVN